MVVNGERWVSAGKTARGDCEAVPQSSLGEERRGERRRACVIEFEVEWRRPRPVRSLECGPVCVMPRHGPSVHFMDRRHGRLE